MVESIVLSCLVIDLNTITELFKKEISPDSWYCRVFFWGTTNLFPVISDSFKDFHEDVGIDRWICKSYIYTPFISTCFSHYVYVPDLYECKASARLIANQKFIMLTPYNSVAMYV